MPPKSEAVLRRCFVRDVTEGKGAQDKLRQSEARFRSVLEGSRDVIYRLNVQTGRFEYVSPSAEEVSGYSAEEFMAMNPMQAAAMVHPDDLPAMRGAIARLEEMDIDITEFRKTQSALKAAGAYNRTLIEASLDPLVTIGPDGKITDVNRATEAATGCSRAELIGNDFSDYFTEPEKARAGYQQAFREETVRDYPLELRHREGRVTSVLYHASVYRDEHGQVAGVFAAARDITARKQAEEALKDANEKLERRVAERTAELRQAEQRQRERAEELQTIFDTAPIGLAIATDPRGHRIRGNRANEEMFGLRSGAELSKAGPQAARFQVFQDGRELEIPELPMQRAIRGEVVREQIMEVVPEDGHTLIVFAKATPLFDEAGGPRGAVGAFLDITALKCAEEALVTAKDELAQANAVLERKVEERTAKLQELVGELEHFSYTITHDMRAPLRAMKGFGSLVSDLCVSCEHQERKEFLGRIIISADRMDALIRDALNYSKAVRQELPLDSVDAGKLLRGMLDSYPEFQQSKAHIRIEGELPVLYANEAGLTQCFSNLLGNAVKFVGPGVKPQIRIWAEPRDGWVRIWFEDSGIGISKAMLPRVFDMFSRGQNTYQGTGIGLALVKKVMNRMGGKLGVESEEGKGSRFWIELKLGELQPWAGA